MSKRKAPGWAGIPEGAALSLGLYILLQCLLALLTVQDMLDPATALRLQIGSAALAALCGGILSAHGTGMGALPAAMAGAASFAVLIVLGGLLICDGLVWSTRGIALLAAALAGGLAAGLLCGRRGGKRRKKPAARTGRARGRA